MQNGDFVRPGVVYGYRAVSEYGSFSDGQGAIYYFGRSQQQCVIDIGEYSDSVQDQKDVLRHKLNRTGLNSPSRILLWKKVDDVDKYWDEFKQQLRGWRRLRDDIEGTSPLITNMLSLGDNFYCVENMNAEDFGVWCRAVVAALLRNQSRELFPRLGHQPEQPGF
jgi:hypothetical protein